MVAWTQKLKLLCNIIFLREKKYRNILSRKSLDCFYLINTGQARCLSIAVAASAVETRVGPVAAALTSPHLQTGNINFIDISNISNIIILWPIRNRHWTMHWHSIDNYILHYSYDEVGTGNSTCNEFMSVFLSNKLKFHHCIHLRQI